MIKILKEKSEKSIEMSVLTEELNFFEKYYYETVLQKTQFISNLKFFYAVSVASFGYLGWIAVKWTKLSLFSPMTVVSILAIILIFCMIVLNIYSFWLSCCIFNPKGYKELPMATSMHTAIKRKSGVEKIEYMRRLPLKRHIS